MKPKKKVVIEDAVVPQVTETKKDKKGEFHLYIKLNDKSFEVDTDNIVETIKSFKPAILKTALTIRITKGKRTIDRYLYLKDGRRLFTNDTTLDMFVRNLSI